MERGNVGRKNKDRQKKDKQKTWSAGVEQHYLKNKKVKSVQVASFVEKKIGPKKEELTQNRMCRNREALS